MDALQESVLDKWKRFTIWNAGKQGRRLYRSLTPENQAKVCIYKFQYLLFINQSNINTHVQVMAFCDVDENKIKQGVYVYEESKVHTGRNALILGIQVLIVI